MFNALNHQSQQITILWPQWNFWVLSDRYRTNVRRSDTICFRWLFKFSVNTVVQKLSSQTIGGSNEEYPKTSKEKIKRLHLVLLLGLKIWGNQRIRVNNSRQSSFSFFSKEKGRVVTTVSNLSLLSYIYRFKRYITENHFSLFSFSFFFPLFSYCFLILFFQTERKTDFSSEETKPDENYKHSTWGKRIFTLLSINSIQALLVP